MCHTLRMKKSRLWSKCVSHDRFSSWQNLRPHLSYRASNIMGPTTSLANYPNVFQVSLAHIPLSHSTLLVSQPVSRLALFDINTRSIYLALPSNARFADFWASRCFHTSWSLAHLRFRLPIWYFPKISIAIVMHTSTFTFVSNNDASSTKSTLQWWR